jgi:hypothetical protein
MRVITTRNEEEVLVVGDRNNHNGCRSLWWSMIGDHILREEIRYHLRGEHAKCTLCRLYFSLFLCYIFFPKK